MHDIFGGPAFRPLANSSTVPTSPKAEATSAVLELQDKVGRLNLMVQTLARLLLAKGVIKEEELQEWMKYVDNLDGVTDGKLRESKAPRECPKCKRMSQPRAGKCQYCGQEFDLVYLDHQDKT